MASLGLRVGESIDIPLRGDCMPALRNVPSARVKRKRVYLPGDVVVVRRADHWSAHRFLGYVPSARGWVAFTQADDSEHADPAALAESILGRVVCAVTVYERGRAVRRYLGATMRRAFRGVV